MAETFERIGTFQLPVSTEQTLFTVPVGETWVILSILIHNDLGDPDDERFCRLLNQQGPADADDLSFTFKYGPKETIRITEKWVLEENHEMRIDPLGATPNVMVNYLKIT